MSTLYLTIIIFFLLIAYELLNNRTYLFLYIFPYYRKNIDHIVQYGLRDLKKKYIRKNAKYNILLLLSYLSSRVPQDKLKQIDGEIRNFGSEVEGDDFRTHLAKATIKASLIRNNPNMSKEYIKDAIKHFQFLQKVMDIAIVKENQDYFFIFYLQMINAFMTIKDYEEVEQILKHASSYKKSFKEGHRKVFIWYKGMYYVNTDQEELASDIFKSIRDDFKEDSIHDSSYYLFMIEKTLANHNRNTGNYNKAIEYYHNALDLVRNSPMRVQLGHHLEEAEINLNDLKNNQE